VKEAEKSSICYHERNAFTLLIDATMPLTGALAGLFSLEQLFFYSPNTKFPNQKTKKNRGHRSKSCLYVCRLSRENIYLIQKTKYLKVIQNA
jgi:hypothetical protein